MNAWETKHQIQLPEWQNRIAECRSSGMSVAQWCRDHKISTKTYYRWEREILGDLNRTPQQVQNTLPATTIEFAEISPRTQMSAYVQPAAVLQMNAFRIEINNGADAATIRAIIEAVKKC